MKTGNAGLSDNQKAVFEKVGKDDYRIPPNSILSKRAAKAIGADYRPGMTVAEAGYPNGIPVLIHRAPGSGG
ncbi:hypothetical protein [Gallaecimonas kandeliae]|uniref:hypothetical protein n=1 Tax=Gallaecimonas kandeliae TaxID=3029055 RepID=UPI003AF32CC5